jgi:hypothetical protein
VSRFVAVSLSLGLLAAAGCTEPRHCAATMPIAIRLAVVDSASGADITSGVVLRVRVGNRDNTNAASNDFRDDGHYQVPGDTGTYRLTVSVAGYATESLPDISVGPIGRYACGGFVQIVTDTAFMRPSAAARPDRQL